MVGVCAVPRYAWYSHKADGTVIEPYHENAIVILLDQGYETMEGASGDDWVSGAQSMRAYMRGAQIAGILSEHIRSLGYSARSQTNVDCDVLAHPARAPRRPGRAEPHRRTGAEPLRRAAVQVGRAHHRHADHPRPPCRLRPPGLLREVHQVRARVSLRRHLLRRQDHVQRLRDVETRRREVHQVPPRQPEGSCVWAVHEDLPVQHRRRARRAGVSVGGHQVALHPQVDRPPRRQGGQRLDQPGEEVVVGSRMDATVAPSSPTREPTPATSTSTAAGSPTNRRSRSTPPT